MVKGIDYIDSITNNLIDLVDSIKKAEKKIHFKTCSYDFTKSVHLIEGIYAAAKYINKKHYPFIFVKADKIEHSSYEIRLKFDYNGIEFFQICSMSEYMRGTL